MNTLTTRVSGEVIEKLALAGDVAGLSRDEKIKYYVALCERVGLDPTTQPFKLLKLSGREVFYCDRGGAQQLSRLHNVSHEIKARDMLNGCYVVTCRASLPDGRHTESIGAVPVDGQKGEAYSNLLMKAETKSKRRATLDLLGLGMLDETEVETIPGARTEALNTPSARLPLSNQPENAPTGIVGARQAVPDTTKEAAESTRKWFLDQLVNYESAAVLAYMWELNWLLPTETFADIPLKFIPTTKEALRNFMSHFETWRDGDVAPTVQREPVTLPDSRQKVAGIISHVSTKIGESKKGKWTLYGIKIGDTFYNTFDHKIGDAALERKGQEATVFFEETERGFNALEIA